MADSIAQFSMARGELSPNLHERVDLQWWSSALKTCRNFITMPYGGVKNRPGTRLVAEVKSSAARVRTFPFRFSSTQSYVLEFGNLYMRVHKDGAQVLYATRTAWLTATAYKVGDERQSGSSTYRCTLAHTSGVFATDLAAAKWSLIGVVGQPVEVVTPYTTAELAAIQFVQSADVMTLDHQSHYPKNVSRTNHDVWTVADATSTQGPWMELNADESIGVYINQETGNGATITASKPLFNTVDVGRLFYIEQRHYQQPWQPDRAVAADVVRRSDGKYYQAVFSGTTGTLRPTHYTDTWSDGSVDWTYLHSGYGVARITAVAADGLTCTADILSRMPAGLLPTVGTPKAVDQIGGSSFGITLRTAAPHGLTAGGVLASDVSYTASDGSAQIYAGTFNFLPLDATHVIITGNHGAFVYSATGSFYVVSAAGTPASNSFRWKFGAWGGDQGYPGVAAYHQGRRIHGGTPGQPNTAWFSRTDNYIDFSETVPSQDDDSITLTLASTQVNALRGMVSADKLLMLTAGAEWILGTGRDDVLTFSNHGPKPQSFRGAAENLQPLSVGDVSLYVQDKGQVVRDLRFSFADDRYIGDDLTVFANHLLEGRTVVEWAYQQHPYGIAWILRDDGVLLGMTYMREQQIVGWHRHDTDGVIESIAVVGEPGEDVLYMAVNRTINGSTKRYIERMHARLVTDVAESVFVDCSLQFDGRNTTATTVTLSSADLGWDDQDSTLVLNSSSPIFTLGSSDVGDQIVFVDGSTTYRLQVTGVNSTTEATVMANKTIPVGYRNVARTDWAWARNVIAGLGHLEGKEVSVLGDGFDLGLYSVAAGLITIDPPCVVVQVGLPYYSDLETLDLNTPNQQTLTDKKKAIAAVRLKVLESRGVWAGRDFEDGNLYEHAQRSTEGYDLPVRLQDGLVEIPITTPWSTEGSVAIRQKSPLPLTITSIIPEVQLGGV